jgi:glycosyltransferase involved in cell wall biosynthesis
MHIALFLPNLGAGGAERVSLTLARAFHGAGHRVSLVVGSTAGHLARDVPAEVELVDLESGRVRSALVGLSRWLRKENPAVLISSQAHANVVAFLAHRFAGSSARLILREVSTPSRSIGQQREPTRSITRALMSTAYRRADAVVAVSRAAALDLQAFLAVQLGNLSVVYNPVITTRVSRLAQEQVDHPWFADNGPVIMSVGRLSEEKDYPTLIRALAGMRTHTDARLLILGEGPLRADLERLVESVGLAGRVSMPGFVSNPYAYMSRADLFVLSSRFEGLPGVLIEALACGCRVTSSDCPSGPREILKDGVLGKLVPVGDVNAMSLAIEESLSMAPGEGVVDAGDLEAYTEQYSMSRYLELVRGSVGESWPQAVSAHNAGVSR